MFLNCGVGEHSRLPWTARISNQSILKEISPEYSLEGLMLKLKLQYFGHLMGRTDSLEKTLMLGKMKVGGEWDGWMASPTQWTWVWVNSGSWWWAGRPGVLQSMGLQRVGHDWATELNWTERRPGIINFNIRPSWISKTGCLGLVHWEDPEGWYREAGGLGMGNTCIPVMDSCWCMAKPIQYCKII